MIMIGYKFNSKVIIMTMGYQTFKNLTNKTFQLNNLIIMKVNYELKIYIFEILLIFSNFNN